ncbi:MAG TPA: VOC family protein [Rhodothermales bacterium]
MRSLLALILSCFLLTATASAQEESAEAPAGPTFTGLASGIYVVPDIEEGAAWYEKALGIAPYFREAFYVGFRIGNTELGLIPAQNGATAGPGGSIPYWIVPDAAAAVERLVAAGATPGAPVMDVGGGTFVASVTDPYGNILGIISSPMGN